MTERCPAKSTNGGEQCELQAGHTYSQHQAHLSYADQRPVLSWPRERTPTDHWAVTVHRNGEAVVTIESNCLSGREIDAEDERVIEMAARNLLGFIGT